MPRAAENDEPGAAPTSGDEIRGVEVDAEGRCAHYRSPKDVVAFHFWCCGVYWAGLADHGRGQALVRVALSLEEVPHQGL